MLSDRILRPDLLHSPRTALADSTELIGRWHGRGRLRYAVTPRFSLSASNEMLDVCAQLLQAGVWFTSHVNENVAEVAAVAGLFPGARHYLDTYRQHGLVTKRSVFAHNVHPSDAELAVLAEHGASVAHCPTSNCALGSGLFPLRRHVEHGIGIALGSDVGAGAGLFLPKEALQAYFIQQMLGAGGMNLTPVHLLYLATRAGARALGLDDRVGDFSVGKDFDAVWLRPAAGSTLAVNLKHARDTTDALARIFSLATPADVAGVWTQGVARGGPPGTLPRRRHPGRGPGPDLDLLEAAADGVADLRRDSQPVIVAQLAQVREGSVRGLGEGRQPVEQRGQAGADRVVGPGHRAPAVPRQQLHVQQRGGVAHQVGGDPPVTRLADQAEPELAGVGRARPVPRPRVPADEELGRAARR